MTELPIVSASPRSQRWTAKQVFVHGVRISLFVAILFCLRFANGPKAQGDSTDQKVDLQNDSIASDVIENVWPGSRLKSFNEKTGGHPIQAADGLVVGNLKDSRNGKEFIGYSGPTRCLIVLGDSSQIESVSIYSSDDTIDHVEAVKKNDAFLNQFRHIEMGKPYDWQGLDAVSGATLTSHAIIATIAEQMGTEPPSLKFDLRPRLSNVKKIFPSATSIQSESRQQFFRVLDEGGQDLGRIISSTPMADNVVGYQGPTAMLLGIGGNGECLGIAVDQSYDNSPYIDYLDDDYTFPPLFVGKKLESIAAMETELNEIEGISGATMTSQAMARILVVTAKEAIQPQAKIGDVPKRTWASYLLDVATICLTLIALSFSFLKTRYQRKLRWVFQVLVVVLIGFVGGHLLSQALLVGWAAHSVPWLGAPGLVFLTVVAFTVPMVSRHQTYCQHLCPMGTLQQWTRNRFRVKLSQSVNRWLKRFSGLGIALLLAWVVFVGATKTQFNLASLEPFDGFSFRVAGWATISILVVGLVSSLFIPMSYCRFGCPTGRVLGYLKFRSDSGRLGWRDVAAALLLLLAVCLRFA